MKLKTSISVIFLLLNILFSNGQGKSLIKEGVKLELIADGYKFTEGPAADKSGDVYFTDQPNNTILKWEHSSDSVSVFMMNAGRSNGLYIGDDGILYSCADEKFQLWEIDPQKKVSILLDNFEGKKFNGPNDLWIDEQGGIYFTDPYYQRPYWERDKPEMESALVYYLTPDHKSVKVVADGFKSPNGIIGSVKDKLLYIADIGDQKTYVYQISENGNLVNKKLFATMGSDGMTMDDQGNVYLTGNGVHILDKNGNLLHHIKVPRDWTSNVTFGGKDFSYLFITASDAVFKIVMDTKGIRTW